MLFLQEIYLIFVLRENFELKCQIFTDIYSFPTLLLVTRKKGE